jgi:hypothetical protein
MMNGFVKIESRQADFVVRVPLDLLLGVPFPLAGDHYNIPASRPAVETAIKALATALERAADRGHLRRANRGAYRAAKQPRSISNAWPSQGGMSAGNTVLEPR